MSARRLPFALVCALLLSFASPTPALADEAISEAERQLFSTPHLENLPPAAVLHYSYRMERAGAPAVEDSVTLTMHTEAQRGRVVSVDYLQGARHLALPEVEHASGSPLILHFLEADVREMHRRLGGMENYFRRRIRLALVDGASTRPVQFEYDGKRVEGTEISIQPYLGDPLEVRFKGLAGKAYVFTLSDQVPGGVYRLSTRVDGEGAGAPVELETLTLQDPGAGTILANGANQKKRETQ